MQENNDIYDIIVASTNFEDISTWTFYEYKLMWEYLRLSGLNRRQSFKLCFACWRAGRKMKKEWKKQR
ncbi:MAG: hypothetical protein KBT27_09305 [Prevotellaceae bacterium]|nr:hypothetical protein [Candidatus Faecinaster equi]